MKTMKASREPEPNEQFNYFSMDLGQYTACLIVERFVNGVRTESDILSDRMDKTMCDCLAELNNRRLLRKKQHISDYWLAHPELGQAEKQA